MNELPETVIYVTREIERALGMEPSGRYHIVSNRTPYGESVKAARPDSVTLIDGDGSESLGTGDLLKRPETAELIASVTASQGRQPRLMVFKNTARIEPLARERGWALLNPPAAASEKIENKISQLAWLGEAARHLPAHSMTLAKDIAWKGEPFILQWAHGHTGDGTTLVSSEAELAAIKQKFPQRMSRVSSYVRGPSFTVNVVATPASILPSTMSYQITGLAPFTDNPFSTIGNDWGAADKMLTESDRAWASSLIAELGDKMRRDSWRGLFGIDIMKDAASGKLYLIEVNARQPASTTYESLLQAELRASGARGLTTFEAHLAALLGQPLDGAAIIPIEYGSQIVQRVTSTVKSVPDDASGSLGLSGCRSISYSNTEMNADLLRVQCAESIIGEDGLFNAKGREIAESLHAI